MLIIIDREYRVYQSDKTTPKMISDVMNEKISIFNTDTMEGINLDLTWSPINKWNDKLIK